jgi:hypothetical protein
VNSCPLQDKVHLKYPRDYSDLGCTLGMLHEKNPNCLEIKRIICFTKEISFMGIIKLIWACVLQGRKTTARYQEGDKIFQKRQ